MKENIIRHTRTRRKSCVEKHISIFAWVCGSRAFFATPRARDLLPLTRAETKNIASIISNKRATMPKQASSQTGLSASGRQKLSLLCRLREPQ
jgi:hypothetical protein